MLYNRKILLQNGKMLHLRNGMAEDGKAVWENFQQTHSETDYLLTYPDENSFTVRQEEEFLQEKAESANEAEILAVTDGIIVGTAGIEAIGTKYKVKHRAEYGISVLKAYWGLGIGRALTNACIECARIAGYTQLELSVVAENRRAIALYESVGFSEYGRNPKGFCSRVTGMQEIVLMRLEL